MLRHNGGGFAAEEASGPTRRYVGRPRPRGGTKRRTAKARSASSPPWFSAPPPQTSTDAAADSSTANLSDPHIVRTRTLPCDEMANILVDGGGSPAVSPKPFEKLLRNTEPQCDEQLPSGDFVEGGVELTPRSGNEDAESWRLDGPATGRQLILLLEDLWPRDRGAKALFLDYDGTLREFEKRPELAVPTKEIKELLEAIDVRQDLVPYIISGRDATFLETHLGGLASFTLIAEHGYKILRPGSERWEQWDHAIVQEDEVWKDAVSEAIDNFVRETPGSLREDKSSSLVWHYRDVAGEAEVRAVAARNVERLRALLATTEMDDIMLVHGHMRVEVLHRQARKGPVMRRLCEEKALFGEPFAAVLAAGDDLSDESMFDAAPRDFVTIKVGAGPTHARFRVESPAELREILWRFIS